MFLDGCAYDSLCDREHDENCNYLSDIFPKTLCNLDCPAVMGFHNSVYADYANIGLYIYGIGLSMGYTPQDAFYTFIDLCGLADRYNPNTGFKAYPLLFGNNITCTIKDLVQKEEPMSTTKEETTEEETTEEDTAEE